MLRSAWSVSQVCILPVYSLHTVCIMSEAWVSQANPKNKVVDPIPGMIVAINMYLQAYHMYRAAALNKPEVKISVLDFSPKFTTFFSK